MATVTVTLSDADASRLTAACTPLGKSAEELVAGYLQGIVQAYEQGQNQAQYLASYTPINPR